MDAQADVAPHIQDDFDLEEGTLQELDVKDNPDFQVRQCHVATAEEYGGTHGKDAGYCLAVQEKLQKRIASAEIKALNPPRPGKKCLVLDIDYTIFDLNSTAGGAPLPAPSANLPSAEHCHPTASFTRP